MSSRGRKRKNDLYFGPEEEKAVVRFIESKDIADRNLIYNEFLMGPINKMVESIIRRYKLYRKGITYEELHADTVSHLIWKSDRFEVGKGKKAYSYYGTICKNYILGLLIKDDKEMRQNTSFDKSSTYLEEREDMTYLLDDTEYTLDDFIKSVSLEIQSELDGIEGKKKITENERKVGEALIVILGNWEGIFESMEGGSKYNKNTVLATIRDYTNLTTKDIRVSMRRFKKLYSLIKNSKIDGGFL